jgi:photosystem II stability/assembly factor-like uncharacterized protein
LFPSGEAFVAVGAQGAIYRSSDGITWAMANDSGIVSDTLYGVEGYGYNYIAVGNNARILSSVGGNSWAIENAGVVGYFRGVLNHQGRWIALGVNGLVCQSDDGVFWDVLPSPLAKTLNAGLGIGDSLLVAGATGSIAMLQAPGQSDYHWPSPDDVRSLVLKVNLYCATGL